MCNNKEKMIIKCRVKNTKKIKSYFFYKKVNLNLKKKIKNILFIKMENIV